MGLEPLTTVVKEVGENNIMQHLHWAIFYLLFLEETQKMLKIVNLVG